jgi:hypothetical protein
MTELSAEEKIRLYDEQHRKRVEAGRKGGSVRNKKFTPETKKRQVDGCRKGGSKCNKKFSPESKARQREGTRLGGSHSHLNKTGGN